MLHSIRSYYKRLAVCPVLYNIALTYLTPSSLYLPLPIPYCAPPPLVTTSLFSIAVCFHFFLSPPNPHSCHPTAGPSYGVLTHLSLPFLNLLCLLLFPLTEILGSLTSAFKSGPHVFDLHPYFPGIRTSVFCCALGFDSLSHPWLVPSSQAGSWCLLLGLSPPSCTGQDSRLQTETTLASLGQRKKMF